MINTKRLSNFYLIFTSENSSASSKFDVVDEKTDW